MTKEEMRGRTVIWTVYIDSRATRSQGRKLPLSEAVESPSVQEVVKAAEALGLNPSLDEAPYPKNWASVRSRVVVDKRLGRIGTLRAIANKVREMRGVRAANTGA